MRDEVRQRVYTTLLLNALTKWESLVTIVVTAILFLFVNDISILGIDWQPWFWLVLGGLAEGALIASTISDPEEAQEALAREFESQYDLSRIRSRVSREYLRKALEYRRNMLKLTKSHSGAMRVSLRNTIEDINNWIALMYDLAEHIDAFESNQLVISDMETVPQKIEKVGYRIEREKHKIEAGDGDPLMVRDLERQLKQLEQQRANLEATKNSMRRAEIQLESTLSSLGTIYAQMSLLGAKEADSGRVQRTRLEIQDEVASLQDTIDAMDEVQTYSSSLSGS